MTAPRDDGAYPWDPDWVVAPGDVLAEWFESTNAPKSLAWKLYGISESTLRRVLSGSHRVTPALAQKLGRMTHTNAPLWLALDHNFRVGLAAGKTWERQ